ncbi:trehalose operon repressor [Gracilibacillus marinus]|uniref:Trehalose operon repressor n=1 Tax=Gracilibacillus marinus TaxID=630535 RepID=A0ABV8VQ35_9BACI
MQKKYIMIYHEMIDQLESGVYRPKELLPSEHELTSIYQTSRETIRKALTLLAQNGYIQKIQGRGSVVIDRNKLDFHVSGLVSFKEVIDKLGEKAETHVQSCELMEASDTLQEQMKVKQSEKIWEIKRVRTFSNERVTLDKDYFVQSFVPHMTKEIARNSIYEYLENELQLAISFAKKEITVEYLTDEDRAYLDVDGFNNIVVIRNYVYLNDAQLFQYTESRQRPDKFRFVDFARRSQN